MDPDAITFADIDSEPSHVVQQRLIVRFGEDRYEAESLRARPCLRFVRYTPLPFRGIVDRDEAVAPGGATSGGTRRLRVDDLVLAIPYLIVALPDGPLPAIPARAVLNTVFESGKVDAGMSGGCEWEPFSIEEDEYAELVAAMQQRGSYRALPQPPRWVRSREDWRIWLAEYDDGVPADEHRRLAAKARAAGAAFDRSWEEAVACGDPLLVVRSWHASLSASRAAADFGAGRPVGSSDAIFNTKIARVARRATDAQMALQAAERIGDANLVARWREEAAAADAALRATVGDDAQATLAKALVNAIAMAPGALGTGPMTDRVRRRLQDRRSAKRRRRQT